MPSIVIREIDNTKGGGSAASTDVVYVPGFMSTVESGDNSAWPNGTADAANSRTPILCTSVAQFESHFGSRPAYFTGDTTYAEFNRVETEEGPVKGTDVFVASGPDKSYLYAKELLNLGIPVLYESMNSVNEADNSVTVKKMYDALSTDVYTVLGDTGEFDVKYLTSGGYPILEVCGTDTKGVSTYSSAAEISATVDVSVFTGENNTAFSKAGEYKVECVDGASWRYGDTVLNAVVSKDTTSNTVKASIESVGLEFIAPIARGFVKGDFATVKVTGTNTKSATVKYTQASVECSVDLDLYLERLLSIVPADLLDNDGLIEDTKKIFTYSSTDSTWSLDTVAVALSDYGISLAEGFVPYDGDSISVHAELDNTFANGIVSKMLSTAYLRGDCVALIDHLDIPDRPLVGTKSVYESIRGYAKTSAYAEFAAAFTPWVTIDCVTLNDTNITYSMPPSFAYLAALAKSIKTNANWIAVAGATRGQVPNLNSDKPLNINSRLTNAIAENRYQNRNDVSINAITNIKPFGYRIWGNRTLKNNGVESNLTATSFLNIRNMISDIKKVAYSACKRLTFEQNNDILWTNFKAEIEPTLDRMKTGAGLSGYKIIKGTTTEKAKLVATIKLYPLYAVEDFDITVTMEDDEIAVS